MTWMICLDPCLYRIERVPLALIEYHSLDYVIWSYSRHQFNVSLITGKTYLLPLI